jgi:hypothetical protein
MSRLLLALLVTLLACQSDADVSGRDGDVGLTIDTGRLDAAAPDVAIPDAVPADAIPDAGIDASPPPLPPGCKPELTSQRVHGDAECLYALDWNGLLPDESVPFVGHAVIIATQEEAPNETSPEATPTSFKYSLEFDSDFVVHCWSFGQPTSWVEGDELWMEAQRGGWFRDGEYSAIAGLFRRGSSDAPFEVAFGGAGNSTSLQDTNADLARVGLTVSYVPICPYVPWRDGYSSGRVARELAFTFANDVGAALTLAPGEQGEIPLPDGRRASIALGAAREWLPDDRADAPSLYHRFLLTIAP